MGIHPFVVFRVLNNLKFVVIRVQEVSNYAAPWHLGRLESESNPLSFEPFIECIDVICIEDYPGSPFSPRFFTSCVQTNFGQWLIWANFRMVEHSSVKGYWQAKGFAVESQGIVNIRHADHG